MRIGYNNDEDLMQHNWFDNIDKNKLINKELLPPIIPEINSETDVDNFNTKYTNERPKMTIITEDLLGELKKYDPMFTGFYYDQITKDPKIWSPFNSNENILSSDNDEDFQSLNSNILKKVPEKFNQEEIIQFPDLKSNDEIKNKFESSPIKDIKKFENEE